ncbi:Hypothetical predicted protein [Paramuricea clavata]|uniref:Uncharacterized protein n=1 Tax=Paramuricea clavata TaxID=317549 RepID=A0A6S7H006_PARCT|nr:Hypothetical predicted protein [Paramuricea clavata]
MCCIFSSAEPPAPAGQNVVDENIPTAAKEPSLQQTIADDGKVIKMECDPSRTTLKRTSGEIGKGLSKRTKADLSDVDSLDIGRFVSVAGIDDDTKFNLINNHWKPPPDFNFPSSETSRRKFCASWLHRRSWLCYSKLYNGAFCLSCVKLDVTAQNYPSYLRNP